MRGEAAPRTGHTASDSTRLRPKLPPGCACPAAVVRVHRSAGRRGPAAYICV